ncbi:hypothetical protein ACFQY3_06885 [Paenibacillus farraposensis]|uniref:hypothetical protein n=1 Tax=Paenibacillus farraposensis TaxID=2807095 RepID=UPI00360E5AE5
MPAPFRGWSCTVGANDFLGCFVVGLHLKGKVIIEVILTRKKYRHRKEKFGR